MHFTENIYIRSTFLLTLISGFRPDVDEICALLGYYAASCGNIFIDVSGQCMGPLRCPETSVNNYYTTPRNIQEERRSHKVFLVFA
jgi:hypothetical protein